MSYVDVQDTLTSINNNTAMINAEKNREKTGTTELDQDAFLQLLLTQLQNQDPLNPMSNEDFMAQQAQLTQVSELQKLNANFTQSNEIMQASSLIGKEVTLTDPNDEEKTITGKVTEARVNGNGASVVLEGQEEDYPIDLIEVIKDPPVA